MLTRRNLLELGLGAAAGARYLLGAEPSPVTPEQALAELVEGNRRFVAGYPKHPNSSLARANRVGKEGQHPHSVVLCCSDSRVPPEILFDQGIGDVFVVRVAGNVANGDEIGSIEYAVEHLSVPLCIVLGHASCGAVGAVVDGERVSKEIQHLVEPIQHSYQEAKSLHPKSERAELIRETVRLNVLATSKALSETELLAEVIRAGRLQIKGAVYDLETSRVEWVAR
jgi:carbonic anhydrase